MKLLIKKGNILLNVHIVLSVIFYMLINLADLANCFELMFVYSLWSLFIYIKLIQNEYLSSKGLTIEMLYLVASVMRFVWPGITDSIDVLNGEKITYMRDYIDVTPYIFPTLVAMNITHGLFYKILRKYRSNINFEDNVSKMVNRFNIIPLAVVLYLLGMIFRYYLMDAITLFSSTLALWVNKMTLGAIMMFVFSTTYNYKRSSYILLVLAVVGEVVYNMFFTFYKTNMIIPILLLLAYYVYKSKYSNTKLFTRKFVSLTVIIFFFVNLIIFPFVNSKRMLNDFDPLTNKGTNTVSNIEIMSDVIANIGKDVSEGEKYGIVSRQNAISVNAFYYGDVIMKDEYHWDLLKKGILVAIPSFLYPNKPKNDIGLMASGYVLTGYFQNTSETTAYTYVGMFGSSYFIGGWLAVIIFTFLNGWVISKSRNYFVSHSDNVLAMIFYFLLLQTAVVTGFEEVHDGGVLRLISIGINVLLVKMTYKVLRFKLL